MFIRIIIIFLVMLSNSIAEEISGIPKVVDGDTIHINNYKFRLEGIDAPEMNNNVKKSPLKFRFSLVLHSIKIIAVGEFQKKN